MKNLLPLALLVPLASTAYADTRSWSMNAGGCVPTDVDVALQGTHYWTVTGGMRVKHKNPDVNDINLVCPVTALNPSVPAPNYLVVYTGNTTGPLTCGVGNRTCKHYVVIGALRSVDLRNGAYSTLCTVSSNVGEFALSNNNGPWLRTYCPLSTSLDTNHFQYWVELTIHRDDANSTPEVNGVELGNASYLNSIPDGDGNTNGGPAY